MVEVSPGFEVTALYVTISVPMEARAQFLNFFSSVNSSPLSALTISRVSAFEMRSFSRRTRKALTRWETSIFVVPVSSMAFLNFCLYGSVQL